MNNKDITPPPRSHTLNELLTLADGRIHASGSAGALALGKACSRDKAWEHCYEFFSLHEQELRHPSPSQDLLVRAATEVSCYLAFFGMFRGSSKLLNTNRDFFIPVIQSCWQQVPEGFHPMGTTDPVFVTNTRKALRKSLKEQFNRISPTTPISDILVSKIMLGMFACTPAYDRNVKQGIATFSYPELVPSFDANIKKWHVFMGNEAVDAFFTEKRKFYYGPNSKIPLNRIADLFFFQLGLT